jgi:hypothetical protein
MHEISRFKTLTLLMYINFVFVKFSERNVPPSLNDQSELSVAFQQQKQYITMETHKREVYSKDSSERG